MTYSLFIDDDRWPSETTWADWYGQRDEWTVARNWNEVEELITTLGVPEFISFDHDLGHNELDGREITIRMIDNLMDNVWELPATFSFSVHSKNVIGKENIESYWNNYLEFIKSV